MPFEHSSINYRKTADHLIEHLCKNLKTTSGRKKWTKGNLELLRSFKIPGVKMSSYPKREISRLSGLKGQFLWDYMSCSDKDVLLIAESEWHTSPIELRHDVEKLLYTRCPIKLMMCGSWDERHAPKSIAADLSKYAKSNCSNFCPGEIFILFCVGWVDGGKRVNDEVFMWQVPGKVCRNDGRKFKLESQWK